MEGRRIIRLDNRGLQPPEPMIRILQAVEQLDAEARLEALLDRRPVFLFPELDERELDYICEPNELSGFTLTVSRTKR